MSSNTTPQVFVISDDSDSASGSTPSAAYDDGHDGFEVHQSADDAMLGKGYMKDADESGYDEDSAYDDAEDSAEETQLSSRTDSVREGSASRSGLHHHHAEELETLRAAITAMMRAVGIRSAVGIEPQHASALKGAQKLPTWGSDVPHVHIAGSMGAIRSATHAFLKLVAGSQSKLSSKKACDDGSSLKATVEALKAAIAAARRDRTPHVGEQLTVPLHIDNEETHHELPVQLSTATAAMTSDEESGWNGLRALFAELAATLAIRSGKDCESKEERAQHDDEEVPPEGSQPSPPSLQTTTPTAVRGDGASAVGVEKDTMCISVAEYDRLTASAEAVREIEERDRNDLRTMYKELQDHRANLLHGTAARDQVAWVAQTIAWQQELAAAEIRSLEEHRQRLTRQLGGGAAGTPAISESEFFSRLDALRNAGETLRQQWQALQQMRQEAKAADAGDVLRNGRATRSDTSTRHLLALDASGERDWFAKLDALRAERDAQSEESRQLRCALDRRVDAESHASAQVIPKLLAEWKAQRDTERATVAKIVQQLVGRPVAWSLPADSTSTVVQMTIDGVTAGAVDVEAPLPDDDWNRQQPSSAPSLELAEALLRRRDAFTARWQQQTVQRRALSDEETVTRSAIETETWATLDAVRDQLLESVRRQTVVELEAAAARRAAELFADSPFGDDAEDVAAVSSDAVVEEPCASLTAVEEGPSMHLAAVADAGSAPPPSLPDANVSADGTGEEPPTPPPSRKRSRSLSPPRSPRSRCSGLPLDESATVTPLVLGDAACSAFAEPDAVEPLTPIVPAPRVEVFSECHQNPPPANVAMSPEPVVVAIEEGFSPSTPVPPTSAAAPVNPFAEEDGFWDTT